MRKQGSEDYLQEVIGRVREVVTTDARFLYDFREQHAEDIEDSLRSADATGDSSFVEEELEFWADKACREYESFDKASTPAIVVDDATVWKRQETLASFVKNFAAEDSQIRRFRTNVLQGNTLSGKEALEFLSSPFTADRRYRSSYPHGKESLLRPLRIEEGQEEGELPHRRVVVQGKRKPLRHKVWPLALTVSRGFLFPGDVTTLWDLRTQRPNLLIEDRTFRSFPHPHDEGTYIVARNGSVLAELFDLSLERLAGYPIVPNKVLWFILTGEFIPSAPVNARYETFRHSEFNRTKVTLEVEAWIPAEEVMKYYRYAQKQTLGKVPRSLDSRALDLIDLIQRTRSKTWKERLRIWNSENSKSSFAQPGHLQQRYERALKRLIGFRD